MDGHSARNNSSIGECGPEDGAWGLRIEHIPSFSSGNGIAVG